MTAQPQQFSDLVVDTGLIGTIALLALTGVPGPGVLLLAVIAGLALMRATGVRDRYDSALERLGYPKHRLNASPLGRAWVAYLYLADIQRKAKPTNRLKGIARFMASYDRLLFNVSYWAMPFILAFGASQLRGAYLLCFVLCIVHLLSIVARYSQVRTWARANHVGYPPQGNTCAPANDP